jgi:pimeloyl-ACP methyl ester carboxylesterase
MTPVQPFEIDIPQSDLADLADRLERTRWCDDAPDAGWADGTDIGYMQELVGYWKTDYDWREHEATLNSLAHFTTQVGGIRLHYVHERSTRSEAPALILTHGWPDSFYRFSRIIPLLKPHFHLVIPSIPGFGFSSHTAVNSVAVADLWVKLMTEVLGYDSFLAAGGDVGAPVTKVLAIYHADVVDAVHLTDVGWPTGQEDFSTLTAAEQQFVQASQQWVMTEGAYLFVQGNKPQSLAFSLNDSPVGLAAWIVSFANAGQPTAFADQAFGGRDHLLTNIMIYWLTQTAGSAARSYREEAKLAYAPPAPRPSRNSAPAAIALFPRDLEFPREWAERQGLNVKRLTKMAEGGHFAALEVPELYARELQTSFAELS